MKAEPGSGFERLNQAREQRRKNFKKAKSAPGNGEDSSAAGVTLDDLFAYMPMHTYIYAPTRDMWPAGSVNARVPPVALVDGSGKPVLDADGKQKFISASAWLDRNKPVEQMTWAPGSPMRVHDRLISEGGWIERKGVTVFNLYRPPLIAPGNAAEAERWLDHVRRVYPDDADHIVKWCAHRVQRPHEKINHALVLGGLQGIGKDTLLEPVKRAIGPWNFSEASPQQVLGRFNGFLKSVILRISEARDLGEVNRFSFYDHLKAYTAAPPDVLRVDEKNLREYSVLNCCGVIITSNHKTDGIFLPADDRRPLRRLVRGPQGGFQQGLLDRDLELLQRWRRSGCCRLSRLARSLGLRRQSATTENTGLLDHRRRQPRPRRRRARRRDRSPLQSGRHDIGANHERGQRRLRDVDQEPREPPRHPPPARTMRLRSGPQ
jgi:hypothetical protein